MGARLLVYTGKLRGKVFSLPPEGKVVLGRSQRATLPLPDVNLSRSHCAVAATPQGYVLSDLESTNGTFMNGKRIKQVLLREADRITIGETELEFRVKERFDDNETKMDLMPVGRPEEISPEEAMQMMRAASGQGSRQTMKVTRKTPIPFDSNAPVSTVPLGLFERVQFCDICDVNIARGDAESGSARQIEDRMVCRECLGRLQGRNLDAAASIGHVLNELRAEVKRSQL